MYVELSVVNTYPGETLRTWSFLLQVITLTVGYRMHTSVRDDRRSIRVALLHARVRDEVLIVRWRMKMTPVLAACRVFTYNTWYLVLCKGLHTCTRCRWWEGGRYFIERWPSCIPILILFWKDPSGWAITSPWALRCGYGNTGPARSKLLILVEPPRKKIGPYDCALHYQVRNKSLYVYIPEDTLWLCAQIVDSCKSGLTTDIIRCTMYVMMIWHRLSVLLDNAW